MEAEYPSFLRNLNTDEYIMDDNSLSFAQMIGHPYRVEREMVVSRYPLRSKRGLFNNTGCGGFRLMLPLMKT